MNPGEIGPEDALKAGSSMPETLKKLKDGAMKGKDLAPEMRLEIVEYLTARGGSASEIGVLLGVTDRTVRRFRRDLRAAHAVCPTRMFGFEVVGQLILDAEMRIQDIQRGLQGLPLKDRILGHKVCWEILRETTKLLQSLGYLPTDPTSNPKIPSMTHQGLRDRLASEVNFIEEGLFPTAQPQLAPAELKGKGPGGDTPAGKGSAGTVGGV